MITVKSFQWVTVQLEIINLWVSASHSWSTAHYFCIEVNDLSLWQLNLYHGTIPMLSSWLSELVTVKSRFKWEREKKSFQYKSFSGFYCINVKAFVGHISMDSSLYWKMKLNHIRPWHPIKLSVSDLFDHLQEAYHFRLLLSYNAAILSPFLPFIYQAQVHCPNLFRRTRR